MTFKKATQVLDKLPAGQERAELQKLLTLFARMVDMADLGDIAAVRHEVQSIAATSQAMTNQHEEDEVFPYLAKQDEVQSFNDLADNLKPSAKLPRGFGFWSETMQRMWMTANQKKATK